MNPRSVNLQIFIINYPLVTIYIWPGMKVVLFCLERWPNKCMDLEKLFVGTLLLGFFFCQEIICLIVFRSDLVQGLGFKFWPGCLDQFFLKNQNDIVLVKEKNKSQRVATGFLTGSYWVTPGFFFNLARFQPQVDPPGRTGF